MKPALLLVPLLLLAPAAPAAPPRIEVSEDGGSFRRAHSGRPFVPWGFNYDRDHKFRLLEEYWEAEWATVEQDFREMKDLGANVVRVHLQFGRFMEAPDKPNAANLARLENLVRLAEEVGLYLDLTGLGSYRKKDVPAWYEALPEPERWAAQARFWEEVAKACADRPGVFCYDLMNEPLVSGDKRKAGEWVHPLALGGLHYVQYVNLDPAGRQRPDIAVEWTRLMVRAVRKHDPRRLVTVGMIPIELGPRPEEASGFVPAKLAKELDFFCLHIYPQKDKFDVGLGMLKRCRELGKPVVIEEIFPLACDAKALGAFIDQSKPHAAGWVGFYWGQTPAELKGSDKVGDVLTLSWLELFREKNPNR